VTLTVSDLLVLRTGEVFWLQSMLEIFKPMMFNQAITGFSLGEKKQPTNQKKKKPKKEQKNPHTPDEPVIAD